MRILMLDLDTLRPDHLGCYGYARNTSPNIDALAKRGVRFSQYYVSDAPCLPSRASLVTGRFGIHSGVVDHGGICADLRDDGMQRGFQSSINTASLAGTLRQAGLKTVSISPFGERHSAWWFHGAYNEVHNTGQHGHESAEEITPLALDWIERNAAEDDWFLHINYWDPHTPYRAPEEFGNPFAGDPLPSWITPEVLAAHRTLAGPHGAQDIAMFDDATSPQFPRQLGQIRDMDDLRRHIDGYDCGIRYLDGHIGKLMSALQGQGVLDDLIILITSDHGENQGELGLYAEHATADAVTCRIPMIIVWPGTAAAGIQDDGLHYSLDLLPTLAELLDVAASPRWDGRSYAPALSGEDCGRASLVVSQCAHVCQRGVRFGDYLYMRTVHDGFHTNFSREMLFNLKDDPHEQHDLSEQRPDLCAQGARILLDWLDDAMARSESDADPLWTVMRGGGPYHAKGYGAQYAQRLEATGRGEQAAILRQRHPGEFLR